MAKLDLLPRHAEQLIAEALTDTRVVLVNGARQTGKSTLTRMAVGERTDATLRLLDDPATLKAAQDDPTGFVDRDSGLIIIDEIQLVPELLRPIKMTVDLARPQGDSCLPGRRGSWRCAHCRMHFPVAWK